MEYTLEDALEALKDAEAEKRKEIEHVTNIITNNDPIAFQRTCDPEDVRKKQQRLCKSLLNEVMRAEPNDHLIPKTSDLHVHVLAGLEEDIRMTQEYLDRTKSNLASIREDISYLKNKKSGLERMKEAYVGTAELTANITYNREHTVTKRMFQLVKKDLHTVVHKLFPDNQNFYDFLADLTAAYSKGGDDLYLDVTPDVLDFVHFLIEANLAVYHRNDKSKVRLMEML